MKRILAFCFILVLFATGSACAFGTVEVSEFIDLQAESDSPEFYILPLENELGLSFDEVSPITADIDTLCEEYEDVIGWLYSPKTVIDYPVVIGRDNQEYLHKTVEGRYNYRGTIFADFFCERDFSNLNTILHGHNMMDGSMFGSINSYRSQEYYEAHPVMYLNTPRQNFRVDIFAAFITPDISEPYTIEFRTKEEYQNYLDDMVQMSVIDAHASPDTEHRILTLSTCSYEYDFARFVVQGILVPIG